MNVKVVIFAVVVTLGFTVTPTETREAWKPVPEIGKELQKFTGMDSPCRLHIQKHLPKDDSAAQPIYLIPNTAFYWLPRESGFLEVPRGESIELYCSTGFLISPLKRSVAPKPLINSERGSLRAVCLQDRTFLWQGDKFEFKQFSCAQQPKYMVQRTNATCGDADADATANIYRVGFNITRQRFVETMRVCYDENTLRTLYTQHRLGPANVHFQRHVKRPNFCKAGHFKEHNINYFYTQQNQWQRVGALLGDDEDLSAYLNNETLFLTRGHLVAKSDQIYASQQRTTFTFFNVAPQWQSFNGGQWAQLEEEVRKFVARARLDIESYSGTWGTLQLPPKMMMGAEGTNVYPQLFHLSDDSNNNGLLPVPLLFYRLLIDCNNPKRGIVLIGLNHPHASIEQIEKEYLICDDISENVSWLNWIRNTNLRKGYLYACAVTDFLRVAKDLPRQLLEVKEIMSLD